MHSITPATTLVVSLHIAGSSLSYDTRSVGATEKEESFQEKQQSLARQVLCSSAMDG